ncbi:hypothetical protein GCM10010216_03110 [Streptomyces flaveolus]|nr:hypothetical protein GCM10010216_03110 [Streptomyces flaveolus]
MRACRAVLLLFLAEPMGCALLGKRGAVSALIVMVREGYFVGWSRDLTRRGRRNGPIEHAASTLRVSGTRGPAPVQAGAGRPIKVRNAYETVLWCDAQVPDRLPPHRRQAA